MKHRLMNFCARSLLALVAAASFLAISARAAWVDAPGPPLANDPLLELPLNTTSTAQTKKGPLTVNKTFTANSDLNVGGSGPGGTSEICWNDDGTRKNCRKSWAVLGVRDFVHLYPDTRNTAPPDLGYAALTGGSNDHFTLKATSGTPNNSDTLFSGVAGVASSSPTGFSAGVFGDASTSAIGSGVSWAVFGEVTNGGTSAFAAYFRGKVALLNGSDLIVGSISAKDVTRARENTVSEVCLNDVCKPEWELDGTSLWSKNGTTLWPSSTSRSVSSGNGAFTAKKLSSRSAVDLSVNGNATLTQIVIGDAPNTLPVTATCGDGMCNGSENDNFCSPRPSCGSYCPEDCDRTAPGNVTNVQSSWNQRTRRLTLAWEFPTDQDYVGTRAVVTRGNPPSGPFGTGDVRDIEKPTTVYITPFLQQGETYYIVLYAYDTVRNYASGIQTIFTVP